MVKSARSLISSEISLLKWKLGQFSKHCKSSKSSGQFLTVSREEMGGITKIFFRWKKRSLSVLFAHFSRKSSYMKSEVTGRRKQHHPPPPEILTPTESHSIFQLYTPWTKERIPSIRTFLSIPLSNTLSYNFIGNSIWATLHLLLFPKCYIFINCLL